jgi:hypothetical protein
MCWAAKRQRCEVCAVVTDVTPHLIVGTQSMEANVCDDCAAAGAQPWWAVVGLTAIAGPENITPEWERVIDATLVRANETRANFDAKVAKNMAAVPVPQ